MNENNWEAYDTLETILNESEEGFYVLLASPRMQKEVVQRYAENNIKIYDFILQKQRYRFAYVVRFLEEKPGADVYILLNMQDALQEDVDIENLNFSRDMLARERKNIIFCMTERTYDRVVKIARDWATFIKLRMDFQEEFGENDVLPTEYESLLDSNQVRHEDSSTGEIFPVDFNLDEKKLRWHAVSYVMIAKNRLKKYRYQDALNALGSAMRIRKKILGEKDLDIAVVYINMANVYHDIGRYSKALKCNQNALAIQLTVLTPDHLDIAESYSRIGMNCRALRRHSQALKYDKKALKIFEKVLPPDHLGLATSYENISIDYIALERNEEASIYVFKARTIRGLTAKDEYERVLSIIRANENDIDIGKVLAWRVADTNEKDIDKKIEWRVADTNEKDIDKKIEWRVIRTDDNNTGIALTLGERLLYLHYLNEEAQNRSLRESERALENVKKALAIRERILPPNHPDLAINYFIVGVHYGVLGRNEEAKKYFEKAKEIREIVEKKKTREQEKR